MGCRRPRPARSSGSGCETHDGARQPWAFSREACGRPSADPRSGGWRSKCFTMEAQRHEGHRFVGNDIRGDWRIQFSVGGAVRTLLAIFRPDQSSRDAPGSGRRVPPSSPGSTRGPIAARAWMDPRVEPGDDGEDRCVIRLFIGDRLHYPIGTSRRAKGCDDPARHRSGWKTSGGGLVAPPPTTLPRWCCCMRASAASRCGETCPYGLPKRPGCGVFAYSRFGYGQSDVTPLPRPMSYMHDEVVDPPARLRRGLHPARHPDRSFRWRLDRGDLRGRRPRSRIARHRV